MGTSRGQPRWAGATQRRSDRNNHLSHRGDVMQLIKAFVRPDKVDDVKEALSKVHVSGMTVAEVRGHGQQKGHTTVYRGKEYNVSLLPKMSIETVVPDDLVDVAIQAIIQAAR